MHQPIEAVIKFYKLRTNEDIVAFEEESTETHYKIRRPLAFTVDNEVMAGKQMLNVREWVPPIVCANDTILLPKEYVMFTTDVKESFKEEFVGATDFLYNITPKKKKEVSRDNITYLKDPSVKPN